MNTKFVVLAVVCAVLLAWQTVSCEDIKGNDKQFDDHMYILNPGSAFPLVITDPENPIYSQERGAVRVCRPSFCQSTCRSWGFRIGLCNNRAVCVCSR